MPHGESLNHLQNPQKNVNPIYEYSNKLVNEKGAGYLSDDDVSSDSLIDDEQDLNNQAILNQVYQGDEGQDLEEGEIRPSTDQVFNRSLQNNHDVRNLQDPLANVYNETSSQTNSGFAKESNQFEGSAHILSKVHDEAHQNNGKTIKISLNNVEQDGTPKKRTYSQAFINEDQQNQEQQRINNSIQVQGNQDTPSKNPSQPSTTIRLNLGFGPSNGGSANKNPEIQQSEPKRLKTTNEIVGEITQQVPTINVPKTSQQKYDELFKQSMNEGLYYNRSLSQIRNSNREYFALETLKKAQERNQLHQNHNSFLHCNYQPGVNFFNYLNVVQNQQSIAKNPTHQQSSQQHKLYQQRTQNGFLVPSLPAHQTQTHGNFQQPNRQLSTFNHFMNQSLVKGSSQGGNQVFPQNIPNQRVTFGITNMSRNELGAQGTQNDYQDITKSIEGNQLDKNIESSSPTKKELSSEKQIEKSNYPQDQNSMSDQVQNGKGGTIQNSDFICITCHRGPPFTRKYAKNQCQTCYKKTKKYQKDSEDYYAINQMMNQGIMGSQGFPQMYPHYPPNIHQGYENMHQGSMMNGHQLKNSSRGNEMGLRDTQVRSSHHEDQELQQQIVE